MCQEKHKKFVVHFSVIIFPYFTSSFPFFYRKNTEFFEGQKSATRPKSEQSTYTMEKGYSYVSNKT